MVSIKQYQNDINFLELQRFVSKVRVLPICEDLLRVIGNDRLFVKTVEWEDLK